MAAVHTLVVATSRRSLLKALFLALFLAASPLMGEVENTFSMIKPNAVKEHHIGEILAIFEKNGLEIVQLKMVRLSSDEAKAFYEEHKNRPFYQELVDFVTSGPVVAIKLKGENGVAKARELIGATDPKKAAPGTIRALYATSLEENAIHGSDSKASAEREILFFFPSH